MFVVLKKINNTNFCVLPQKFSVKNRKQKLCSFITQFVDIVVCSSNDTINWFLSGIRVEVKTPKEALSFN